MAVRTLPETAPTTMTAMPTQNSHGWANGKANALISEPRQMIATAVQAAMLLPWPTAPAAGRWAVC